MVDIGSRSLSIQDFSDIVFKSDKISLNPVALEKVDASFQFLQHFSTGKLIYGINTGFGPMAQYKISDENRLQLQYNLIRSHSSGMGKPDEPAARQSHPRRPAEQPDAGTFRHPSQPGGITGGHDQPGHYSLYL